jgi:hypothetical protein
MPRLSSGIRAVSAATLVIVSTACTATQSVPGASARTTHGSAAAQVKHTASAASYPVIYLGSMAGEWADPSVRPPLLDLGADWDISGLRWADWGQDGAAGHGTYDACAGAGGPCDRFQAAITVTEVRKHDGTRYFATMKIIGRDQPTMWLVMNGFGVWQQS